MIKILSVMLLTISSGGPAATDEHTDLAVVSDVDLSRYTGSWYEIARLPNRFQTHCAGDVVATYTLLANGQLKVTNECCQENGRRDVAEGRAKPAHKDGPGSKLKVRFAPAWLSWLPAVWGNYWIIDLGTDYGYSVVGTPDRKYLWILSR